MRLLDLLAESLAARIRAELHCAVSIDIQHESDLVLTIKPPSASSPIIIDVGAREVTIRPNKWAQTRLYFYEQSYGLDKLLDRVRFLLNGPGAHLSILHGLQEELSQKLSRYHFCVHEPEIFPLDDDPYIITIFQHANDPVSCQIKTLSDQIQVIDLRRNADDYGVRELRSWLFQYEDPDMIDQVVSKVTEVLF